MTPRLRSAGLALLAPAVLAGAVVSALEGFRLVRPRSPMFAPPETFTLADAIEQHDVARAYALLRQGLDPNDVIVVTHPTLTLGKPRFVSPLWWAVAMRDEHAVLMLIAAGATIQHTEGRDADCLARAIGAGTILAVLQRHAAPADGGCTVPDK